LRALQERKIRPVGLDREVEVNARIVAATNKDLAAAVRDNQFRPDLYARLAQVELCLLPLRQRKSEVLELVHVLAKEAGLHFRLTANAAEALLLWDYPFNVREIQSMLHALPVVTDVGGEIHCADLERVNAKWVEPILKRQGSARPKSAPPSPLVSRDQLKGLLEKHGGNVSKVAQEANMARVQVYRLLKKFGLDLGQHRD
jgi:transcriptional regulator with GAF, ATPase, and Fis domain